MVRSRGLEPPRLAAPVPQTGVSTNFTTTALKPSEAAEPYINLEVVVYNFLASWAL